MNRTLFLTILAVGLHLGAGWSPIASSWRVDEPSVVWSDLEAALEEIESLGRSASRVDQRDEVSDPLGDTFNDDGDFVDIRGLGARYIGDALQVQADFDLSPGFVVGPTRAITGILDLDVDQNPNTGLSPTAENLGLLPTGSTGMGKEFSIIFDSRFGNAQVRDVVNDLIVGNVPATFDDDALGFSIPAEFVGLGPGADVNASLVMGTLEAPTDVAPNQGHLSTGGTPTSILLNDDRFMVDVDWRRPPQFPQTGPAFVADARTDDSGIFYFLDPDNWEMLIKVLDGCGVNNHFWVFFAATTDVEFTVTVTDTQDGQSKQYFNALGQAADAVTDTQAFATCP